VETVAIHFPISEHKISEIIHLGHLYVAVAQVDPLSFHGLKFSEALTDSLMDEINSTSNQSI
jgi:hypothetical protein